MSAEWTRTLCVLLCLACCVLALLPAHRLRASDALRVVVRIASTADRALLPRVRGQLSDVSAQLIVVETAPLEDSFAGQVQLAHELAERESAEVVLWFASVTEGVQSVLVHVAMPREGRILTRRLQAESAAASSKLDSGVLEAAALAVRSAVSALAAGGSIGITTEAAIAATGGENSARAMQPSAAPEARKLPAALPDAERDDSAPIMGAGGSPVQARSQFFFGVQGLIDGQSASGQRALHARASMLLGAFSLTAYGSYALPATIPDDVFLLRVARHAAGGALDVRTDLSPRTSLAVGLHAGAALFVRTSRAKTAEARANPDALTAAFAFGPETELAWLFAEHWGVGLHLALDVLPNSPLFRAQAAADGVSSPQAHQLWAFQPRLSVGFEGALP